MACPRRLVTDDARPPLRVQIDRASVGVERRRQYLHHATASSSAEPFARAADEFRTWT
jgi:hypothetical protein